MTGFQCFPIAAQSHLLPLRPKRWLGLGERGEFRSTGKDGKPVVAYGKYNTIWKKQRDGTWKVVLDMGNSSPEPKT